MSDFKRRKIDESTLHQQHQQEKILEYIKAAPVEELQPEIYNLEWLENLSRQLSTAIKENSAVRIKHPNDPLKFLNSEVNLNSLIKQISNITLADIPLYRDFIRLNANSLEELISHPNQDIINQFLIVFNDLIDSEYESDQQEFIEYISEHQIMDFLAKYFEQVEEDDAKITIMNIFNELTNYELYEENVRKQLIELDDFTDSLINLIRQVRTLGEITYVHELINDYLYKIVSYDPIKFLKKHQFYIEVFLVQLSHFTNIEPEDGSTQENFIETGISTLNILISQREGQQIFLQHEGFELILILIKNGDWGFKTFVKISNYLIENINDTNNVDLSVAIIDSNFFLSHVFKILNKLKDRDGVYQILKILVKLLIFLPFGSDQRIRLINKLVTKNYKSLNVILKIESRYEQNVSKLDGNFKFNDLYLEKIENGLDILQQVSVFKSWLLIEDEKLKNDMIHMKHFNLEKIEQVLTGYKDELKFNYDNSTDQEVKNEFFEYTSMINELLANLYT